MRSALATPTVKFPQIRMRHESQEIREFGNVQLAIPVAVGHLEPGLDEAKHFGFGDRTRIAAAFIVTGVFQCEIPPNAWSIVQRRL